MHILGVIASSIKRGISDLFTRTTSGSLGTATSGQTWAATRGVWFANGGQAQSTDAATGYPLASIPFNQNATVTASVSEGTGVAFWVTDANSWWASTVYGTTSAYSCNCLTGCSSCYSCDGCGFTCNTCASCASCGSTANSCTYTLYYTAATMANCIDGGGTWGSGSNCSGSGNCHAVVTGGNASCCGSTCNTCQDCKGCGATCNTCANCTLCGTYQYNCSTCYTNSYYLRLLSSVGGTVSTATGDISLGSSTAAAIKANTSSGTITAKAYSDIAMTTQLGSTMTLTPVGPTIGTGVGIVKAPTSNTQGSTVDNFTAN